jgi:hypothetical protein
VCVRACVCVWDNMEGVRQGHLADTRGLGGQNIILFNLKIIIKHGCVKISFIALLTHCSWTFVNIRLREHLIFKVFIKYYDEYNHCYATVR